MRGCVSEESLASSDIKTSTTAQNLPIMKAQPFQSMPGLFKSKLFYLDLTSIYLACILACDFIPFE